MWDGESGRKAYHGQCCCNCHNCKSTCSTTYQSKILKAKISQHEAEVRLKLIKAQLGIKE